MASSRKLNLCGPAIRKLRTAMGLSQAELAARCQRAEWDVSRDVIARIEGQRRWVGDIELLHLADILRVDVRELLRR
ncbi:Helix-turn-helix domain-containing protein [Verrucomicrobium sp. GAS474]|uniref:helix-turn-helix domain-containing protein n=1 Tax=Verrucomicrobium sp. GAS474 TaxID=1882831 RepID=UPI0008796D75|nr:helix-turn-helix transcriptional regulator [Verrucomicrobium sp. GAS474]SDT88964.1 Helix-turn-helix domain-containing protein [Verrucomicrobium sp. GAS474]